MNRRQYFVQSYEPSVESDSRGMLHYLFYKRGNKERCWLASFVYTTKLSHAQDLADALQKAYEAGRMDADDDAEKLAEAITNGQNEGGSDG